MRVYYCEHKKIKINCNICSAHLWCKHKTRKYNCVTCYPQGFCRHEIRKNNCMTCKFEYCVHGILEKLCTACRPNILCMHRRKKSKCKDCKSQKIASVFGDKKIIVIKECVIDKLLVKKCIHDQAVSACNICNFTYFCHQHADINCVLC